MRSTKRGGRLDWVREICTQPLQLQAPLGAVAVLTGRKRTGRCPGIALAAQARGRGGGLSGGRDSAGWVLFRGWLKCPAKATSSLGLFFHWEPARHHGLAIQDNCPHCEEEGREEEK